MSPYLPREGAQTLEERLAELTAGGEIHPAAMRPSDPRAFKEGRHVPGALRRFLEDRE